MAVVAGVVGGVIVLAVVTVAAAVLAERWARTRGLEHARDRLAAHLRTDTITLDVPERPLLPALLHGPGTGAEIGAHDVPVGDRDAHLRDLAASVTDVRVDLRRRSLVTGAGSFTALVGQEDLGRLLKLPGVVSRLELRATGLRVWTLLGVPVDADVLLRDGGLLLLPDPVQVTKLLQLPGLSAFRRTIEAGGLRLALPDLPLGATITDLVFGDGEVVVIGTLEGQAFPLADRDAV